MEWTKYLNSNRLKESTRDRTNDPRNEFESDYGRIIFSPALRRMHDKTQVFPLTSDDNIHSRLTHSMEVMSIGYSLGLRLCESEKFIEIFKEDEKALVRKIPIILQNASLVHDIGNPPFGHFGETVIKNFFKKYFDDVKVKSQISEEEKDDFKEFDGNAQGLRVLSKLQVLDDKFGLNLTFATLGAFLKYPNSGTIDTNKLSQSKRGVFQSEKNYLVEIGNECGLQIGNIYKRHPLSFLMEAADSICYLVMDIEDGFNKGWYSYENIKGFLFDIDGLPDQFEKLEKKHNRVRHEISRVVGLRIHLIKRLVDLAIFNFEKNIDVINAGDYNIELIKDDPFQLAKRLFKFCKTFIFPKREIQSLELTGHSVLTGLLSYFTEFIFSNNEDYVKRALGLMSDSIICASLIENETDNFEELSDYYKLRVIVDYITGMTDQYALNQFQKLSGQKII